MSRVPQFFCDTLDWETDEAILTGGEHVHLKRVLRLREGDAVFVSDGKGRLARAVIADIGRDATRVRIEGESRLNPESPLDITLIQAVPKHRKMEWILQKATELGVARVVPVVSAFSVPRVAGERWRRKRDRWRQILREAAKQSHRARIPHLEDLLPVEEALIRYRSGENLFFTPRGAVSLKEYLDNSKETNKMTIAVGPEGGFSPREHDTALGLGYHLCTMGPRIMRLETAVIKVLAVLQFVRGDG